MIVPVIPMQLPKTVPIKTFFIIIMLFTSAVYAASAADSNKLKLRHLQSTIKQIAADIDASNSVKQRHSTELSRLERQLNKLQQQQRQLQQQLNAGNRQIAQEQQNSASQRQQLAKAQQAIERGLRAAYMGGAHTELHLLLNQNDPQHMSRLYMYLQYINRELAQKLKASQALLASYTATEQRLAKEREQLEQTLKQSAANFAQINSAILARQQLLAKIKQSLSSDQHKLAKLKNDAKQLQRLIDKLDKIQLSSDTDTKLANNLTSFAKLRGKLPAPIKAPRLKPHQAQRAIRRGLSYAAKLGQPVYSIAAGKVEFADYFSGMGNLLLINHGDGYMSLYAHNQELRQSVGAWVRSGELIATAGNSGGQAQAVLYFELRHNTKTIDASSWLVPQR